MTQTRIPIEPPQHRYAVAISRPSGIELLGYLDAPDALAAIQQARAAGCGHDCGVLPWRACTSSQRRLALRRKVDQWGA